MLGEEKVVEKLVHVPGDVFAGITAEQLGLVVMLLEEWATELGEAKDAAGLLSTEMLVEVTAFEWVAEALRKVRGIVESEGTNQ